MKKLLILALLFYSFFVNAQNAQDIIDGLKHELKANPDDKKRATIYSDLTWYYSNISTDSALVYGDKAILESTKLGDSTLIAQCYSDVAVVYMRKNDYKKSKENYIKAYTIRKLRKDKIGMAKISANLASIYNAENKTTLALKHYLEAIDFFQSIKKYDIVALTNSNVADIFYKQKNYDKSIEYSKKAIKFQETDNKIAEISNSYLILANSFLAKKDTVQALNYYNKSLKSAQKFGNNLTLSSALNNISIIATKRNQLKKTDSLLNASQKLREKMNFTNDNSIFRINKGKRYMAIGKYKEAKIEFLIAKKDATKEKSNSLSFLDAYNNLAIVNSYLNYPDSVAFYIQKSMEQQDVVLLSKVSKQTAELETKYQTTKKEKLLLVKDAEAKQKNNTIIILSILAFALSLIGFLIYRQQKLKNSQQEQEFKLKSAIEKIETQNKLQEQRLSISRDLHDNIGSQLTFIISSVDNVKYGFDITNEKLDNKLTNISSFAKDTIVELRDTIWAMNSSEISYQDLEIRINNFIEKAKEVKDNISFSFAIDESLKNKKLTSVEGMNLYRTIQEAINNSLKYAQANIVSVNIKKQETQTKITIADNGLGFDMETAEKGNGLKNMQKRIEEIGGMFAIQSSTEGTKIEILI